MTGLIFALDGNSGGWNVDGGRGGGGDGTGCGSGSGGCRGRGGSGGRGRDGCRDAILSLLGKGKG